MYSHEKVHTRPISVATRISSRRACGLAALRYKLKTIWQISPSFEVLINSALQGSEGYVMDLRAWRRGAFNLHKSGTPRFGTRTRAREPGNPSPPRGRGRKNISRHRNGSFYRSIERKPARGIYTAVQFAEPKVTCVRADVNKGTVKRDEIPR